MNELQVFKNQEFGSVRTLVINNEPWFVGKDVAEVLGYAKARNAIAQHVDEDDALKQGITDSLGRRQETTFINESGLYCLVLSSKLPSARALITTCLHRRPWTSVYLKSRKALTSTVQE